MERNNNKTTANFGKKWNLGCGGLTTRIKLIGCKWVFIMKYKTNGKVERYYTKTFAPTAKLNTTRVLLSLVAYLD